MLSRLKEAYYRRKLGADKAAKVLRTEAALAILQPSEAWIEWLWALPPEKWEEAIELGRLEVKVVEARESAVRAITQPNKCRQRSPASPEALAAEVKAERMKGEAMDREVAFRAARLRLTAESRIPALRPNPFAPSN